MTLRINIWSSPRNVSTAMMYAWRQRADTTVVDEPLYAHYLAASGRRHPGTDEVLASQSTDGREVIDDIILAGYDTPIVLFKQMAKHLIDLDRAFLDRCRNVLLTRDPQEMLTSFQKQMPDTTIDDTGFVEMIEILDATLAGGGEPIVVDAKALLTDPPAVLRRLCERLGVAFDPAMLSWPAGPKPEDGVWAEHWYHAVHRSTGWSPWRPRAERLLPGSEPVLEEAMAMYRRLLDHAID